MLNNLANTNRNGTSYKQPVEEVSKYNELQEEIDNLTVRVDDNTVAIDNIESDITSLDNRIQAVEDNTTFPEVNTDRINPITGSAVEIPNIDSDNIDAVNITTATLTVNGTDFDDVRQDAATAKANSQTAINTADTAEDKADEAIGKVQQLKEQLQEEVVTEGLSATTAAITNTVSAGQIVTSDLTAVDAEINTLYTSKIVAKDVISPSQDEPYTTITIPKGITVSFKGLNKTLNDVIHEWRITVQDGSVVFKQDVDQIIRDISFDKATGNTKIRINNVYGDIEYISTVVDGTGPITNEAMGTAYTDYVYAPLKVSGIIYKGYADDSTIIEIPAIIHAYAIQADEQRYERETVDIIRINDVIELPENWGTGVVTTYSAGEENQYISMQTKSGVTKPTWTSPIHSTIGSLSYSSKLVDEATVASYKGISETRQTETITITNEASLQQLTAFHWTKNGTYWQPYELTRITIGDNTMWIDPTEANQGIRFYDNQVIADGTWDDVPVEEANAVPVNLVIFDAPTELSFPITNLGDKTTVHGEITATCFKGNVLGNVTGNADTATNATCFDNKTYAEAKADILSGCAADSNMFNGKTYSEACADILSGNAASADNATCFDGKTYAEAKTDILSGCAANANDATCFNGKTYSEAKTDILTGTAAQAHCVDIDSLTTNSYPLVMESTTCELGKSGTCSITFTPSTGILETNQVSTSCIENSGTIQSQCLCATCDINVDGNAYITGDLTVQGTITTTHSEEVVTPSENIILRDGATTPIASGCYSGFTVTNYDGQDHNLEIGTDKDGTLHVGVVGETMEPIATRATEACMEDGYAAHWDATGTDLVTKGATNTHGLTVNGNASVTGTLTADLTGTADNATKFDNKTYVEACADILAGCACTADNATCFGGCTYECAKADILSGCAADSAKLGNKLSSCYIDNSSTAQTKAGNLSIGAPAACTSTSAGGSGVGIKDSACLELYANEPAIDFHYQKYCGDYSSRITTTYTTNDCNGVVRMTVNNGKGCTAATRTANFDFMSDGTFTGASYIYASCDIYSAGCPVVTTGTLPTVAPGYNCTGTSNYVVTTMVCCAKQICRNTASAGTCHLALFSDKTAIANADLYVSNACPLTYNPATGALTATTVCDCLGVLQTSKTQVTVTNIGLTAGECYPLQTVIDCLLHCYGSKPAVYSFAFANASNPYICEGSMYAYNYRIEKLDSNDPVNVNWQKTQWKVEACTGKSWTVSAYVGATADSITWKTVENIPTVSHIITSSCNAEYPLVFSTCCATPANGDYTLYNDSANNLMYNPSTNTLTTTCVRGLCSVIVGCPTGCTSTQAGVGGARLAGGIELYHGSPFIDFHHNNACADCSHRLIALNGHFQLIATNATGCCAATQCACFDFCSNGQFRSQGDIYVGSGSDATNTAYSMIKNGGVELSSTNPALDFHFNCYCGNYSARLVNNGQGQTQLIVNNGTGTTVASESTTYCFKSDGTFSGACVTITRDTCTMCVNGFNAGTNNYADLKFQATCCDATTRCNWNMCLCGCNGKLYNPQGFVGPVTGSATTVCRTATHNNAACQLALLSGCSTLADSSIYVADTCPLTYNPATGALTACTFCGVLCGEAETTEYANINDVNSGSQDILMTSATGPLGIVNASTGTNACPLKFNPATGVLTTCSVEAKSFKPTCYNWSQSITGIKLDGTTLCMCLA